MPPDLFDYVETFSAPLRICGFVKQRQSLPKINKNVLLGQEILLRFSLILSTKVCLLRENFKNFDSEGLWFLDFKNCLMMRE